MKEKEELPSLPTKRVKLLLIETIPYKKVEETVRFVKGDTNEVMEKKVIAQAMVSHFLDNVWDKFGQALRRVEGVNIEVEYIGITEDKKDFSYGVELIYTTPYYPKDYPQVEDERDVLLDEEVRNILKEEKLTYAEGKA